MPVGGVTETHHVVVDGSNLATEGRTSPSLRQLDEAVRAYAEEDPAAQIVVVVDASFEHRIDPSERAQFEQAELHGEVVSPPAGAIGRGDAFVLRIAERTNAVVLSNDSFQEFHGEHPWLFDEGRLVGGKPVPGVGWIFTPRSPVRGPKSREATGKAKREAAEPLGAPAKAAELAKAARKAAARRAAVISGQPPKVGDTWPTASPAAGHSNGSSGPVEEPGPESPAPAKTAAKKATATKKAAKVKKAAKAAPPKAGAAKKATKKGAKKATEKAAAKKVAAKKKAAPAGVGALEVVAPNVTTSVGKRAKKVATAPKKAAVKAAKRTRKAAPAAKAAAAPEKAEMAVAPVVEGPGLIGGLPRVAARDDLVEAIGAATAEVLAPPTEDAGRTKQKPKDTKTKVGRARADDKDKDKEKDKAAKDKPNSKRRRRTATPPPAVNEPLLFLTFVAQHPVGSEIEGEVASFTSHGAMVEVTTSDGGTLFCYIPLSAMGDPAPRKAREVLRRGEKRMFRLVSLDAARRVAELALPEPAPSGAAEGSSA